MSVKSDSATLGQTSLPSGHSIDNPYSPAYISSLIGEDQFNSVYGNFWSGTTRQNDLLNAGLDFNAQLALMDYDNEYNSPFAKAQRMRQAGLNPDLAGIDGVTDSVGTSGNAQLGDGVGASGAEKISAITGVVNTALDQVNQTMNEYMNMRSMSLDNDSKAIANAQAMRNLAISGVSSVYDPVTGSLDSNMPTAKQMGLNTKHSQKLYLQTLQSLVNNKPDGTADVSKDVRNNAMAMSKEYLDSVTGYFGDRQKAGYSDDFKVYEMASNLIREFQEDAAFAVNASDKYNYGYYSNMDGSKIAGYDMDNAYTSNQSARGTYTVQKSFYDTMKKWQHIADTDQGMKGAAARIALGSIGAASLGFSAPSPHFSSSAGQYGRSFGLSF